MKCLARGVLAFGVLGTGWSWAAAPTSPSEIKPLIEQAVRSASSARGFVVDPRLLNEMTASAVIFAGNFCYPPDSAKGEDICRRTLQDPQVLANHVAGLMGTIIDSQPERVTSLGARLARSVGMNFTMAGWPEEIANTAGVVDLEGGGRQGTVSLATATGPLVLGRGAKVAVMAPGNHEFIFKAENAAEARAQVSLQPRGRTTAKLSSTAVASSRGRIEPTTDLFCYGKPPDPLPLPLGMHNWGRATFGESESDKERNRAPVTRQVALDIRIVDESDGTCAAACQIGLGIAFAQALAVWRTGCERCDPNAFAVLRVGNSIWVDGRIVDRIRVRKRNSQAVTLDLAATVLDEGAKSLFAPSTWTPTTKIVSYEQVDGDKEMADAICALPLSEARWVEGTRWLVCGGTRASTAELKPVLRIRPTQTSCGPSTAFIACGTPGGSIEITLERNSFIVPSPSGAFALGRQSENPSIDIREVVIHEVGHWFGVPHLEIAGSGISLDLMSETYGDGKPCVSENSLRMMNNASDLRWEYRVTEGKGLRRPRAGR